MAIWVSRKKRASVRRFLWLLVVDGLVVCLLQGCLAWFQSPPTKTPVDTDALAPLATTPSGNVSLPILMYHSVREGPESAYSITPQTFRRDLQYLQENGYTTVSPEAVIAFVYAGAPLPQKPILLTFDDGYYNNLCDVLPLLETYDMCACINLVGEFTMQVAVADPHIPAYSYLTPEDLRTLQASSRISFGNHTNRLHHRDSRPGCQIRPNESERNYHAFLYADLSAWQQTLREILSAAPIVFAYPYGLDCPESVPVLRELGFLMSLTCYEHLNYLSADPNCLFHMGRFNRPGAVSTEAFFARLS